MASPCSTILAATARRGAGAGFALFPRRGGGVPVAGRCRAAAGAGPLPRFVSSTPAYKHDLAALETRDLIYKQNNPGAADVKLVVPSILSSGHARLAVEAAKRGATVTLSQRMMGKVTRNLLNDIDLIVYDMAGTTVEEGGTVYRTLQQAMQEDGLDVSNEAMHPWHGAKKEKVIEHFVRESGYVSDEQIEARILRISDVFIQRIQEAYYSGDSKVALIQEGLLDYIQGLQKAGVQVALDTGYPQDIQQGLVTHLGFDKVVDAYISSYEVAEGRPYPYMIHRLMERCGIQNAKRVCKVGDSVRDIEEGRNAGCGLVVGVLSGADSAEALMEAGADVIANSVMDLPIPRTQGREAALKLPDLS